MGAPVTEYAARFAVGDQVRIAERATLQRFERPGWKYHHPLKANQLPLAGTRAIVVSVGYYHGGDVLYRLDGLPGEWHEATLREM